MPKTEYTVENGGLRMEFDIFYGLDDAGNCKELDDIRCTGLSVCPDDTFYRMPSLMPVEVLSDAEKIAWSLSVSIIEQIEGELLAMKQADAERRGEGDR